MAKGRAYDNLYARLETKKGELFLKKTYALILNHSWIELCRKYPSFNVIYFFIILEITTILGKK